MLLWVAAGMLDAASAQMVDDADVVAVSSAAIWEIEIKRAGGRLVAPPDVGERALAEGYESLDVSFQHAIVAGRLPPHHSDPFDRMLIAQARVEGLTLATADAAIDRYDVRTIAMARS